MYFDIFKSQPSKRAYDYHQFINKVNINKTKQPKHYQCDLYYDDLRIKTLLSVKSRTTHLPIYFGNILQIVHRIKLMTSNHQNDEIK